MQGKLRKYGEVNYLGTTSRNENYIREEIKSGLNSVNASHHSIFLSPRLLFENLKTEIILPLYASQTWSFILKKNAE
jgi:hypothetical protein